MSRTRRKPQALKYQDVLSNLTEDSEEISKGLKTYNNNRTYLPPFQCKSCGWKITLETDNDNLKENVKEAGECAKCKPSAWTTQRKAKPPAPTKEEWENFWKD